MDASIADAAALAIVDAEPDVSLHDVIEHGISLLEDVGNIVQANMASCDAMGDRLEEFKQKHPDAAADVDLIYEPKYATEFKRLQPEFRKRFKAAWAKVQPGINKCNQAPKVNKLIHDIWGDKPEDPGPRPW